MENKVISTCHGPRTSVFNLLDTDWQPHPTKTITTTIINGLYTRGNYQYTIDLFDKTGLLRTIKFLLADPPKRTAQLLIKAAEQLQVLSETPTVNVLSSYSFTNKGKAWEQTGTSSSTEEGRPKAIPQNLARYMKYSTILLLKEYGHTHNNDEKSKTFAATMWEKLGFGELEGCPSTFVNQLSEEDILQELEDLQLSQ